MIRKQSLNMVDWESFRNTVLKSQNNAQREVLKSGILKNSWRMDVMFSCEIDKFDPIGCLYTTAVSEPNWKHIIKR